MHDDRIRELERENQRLRELLAQRSRVASNPALASYYAAVDKRMAEFADKTPRETQHLRMWIASKVKQAVGIKRLDELTEEHLKVALPIVHKFGRHPYWDDADQLCACELCVPDLEEHAADLRERLERIHQEYRQRVGELQTALERVEEALRRAHSSSQATKTA